jgi:4-diphosphocytidyl-2-C-methyl-D-erythritol kinase
MTRKARLRAFAKLNLGLRVLYKRTDGYHELRTVFQTISLADQLEIAFTPAAETTIKIHGTPEIPDNLVEKAARLALEAMSIHGDVRFRLKKNIPAGAGLGGGSSDAAAVLLALPVLAGKPIEYGELSRIAAQLGSDVPFFLLGGTALGLGRGEELYPLPEAAGGHILLVAPEIHSSTAEAYRDLSETLTSIALQNKLTTFQQQLWAGLNGVSDNDFEAVVFARHPDLRQVRDCLLSLGATRAMMTGSGSAIFGVFADRETLEAAGRSLPNQKVFPISFISRAKYRSQWQRALKQYLAPPTGTRPGIRQDPWPPQSLSAQ